ncbi:hypothetical protein Plec18167_002539 [Paecilomyces lecythidis]|uniref:RING-type domain-containing protein n=1 Tax=Paecilomyces lecythidis TaxID=3004212 RepID=A0ABR3Y6I4_9EURO
MSSPTTTAAAAAATTSAGGNGGGSGDSGPTNSPLLFFVALGFGVVFTNLWIIVGVKYCFRYNQRNRQLRNEETGEPIDLITVPRPHRRRREKKLMTMDEVNERFPLTKYKAWRSTRADEGLPTAGGIAAPSSRPQSLKNEDGVSTVTVGISVSPEATPSAPAGAHRRVASTSSDLSSTIEQVEHTEHVLSRSDEKGEAGLPVHDDRPLESSNTDSNETNADDTANKKPRTSTDNDNDPIQTAISAELLPDPGDSCAICLDLIEDDDEIRGLTCGHVFHASCVDPWLTSRRACCPLCKADYYVPKPRPEGAEAAQEDGRHGRRTHGRTSAPTQPQAIFVGGRVNLFRPRVVLPSRSMGPLPQGDTRSPVRTQDNVANPPNTTENEQRPSGWRSILTSARSTLLPSSSGRPASSHSRRGLRLSSNADSRGSREEPTPRQLEAGSAV